jgi:branched-chain amino acid transport system permease protein
MSRFVDSRFVVVTLVSVLLLLEPLAALATHNGFLLVVSTRIVIMAIAASSLNLILGYGGMVSFGHAAYLGIGGYAVGILAHAGINSGFVQWPVAIVASATFALAVGLLSLRTRGVYFIMITLAFAQMVYYVATGLDEFGGDDGLTIYRRSEFAGLIDLSNKMVFYYLCLALLAGTVFLVWRVANSRFGLVIQGSRSNDRRMHALGFPTYRYRVVCFVIAGMLCGLAGALLANQSDFISPATMHWTRSGDLLVMVILGGMRSLFGPVFGAIALLVLEETLSEITEYWQIILGPLFLLVVLYGRGGIDGMLTHLATRAPGTTGARWAPVGAEALAPTRDRRARGESPAAERALGGVPNA